WSVFQAFVMNFFKAEQSEFSVSSEYIRWDALALNAEIAQYLPVMHTDVTLRSKDRTIVIDTKYYPEALSENYGKKRIKSDHLYQQYAYLKNCKSGRSRDARQVGMRPCCEGRRLQSIRSQADRLVPDRLDRGRSAPAIASPPAKSHPTAEPAEPGGMPPGMP